MKIAAVLDSGLIVPLDEILIVDVAESDVAALNEMGEAGDSEARDRIKARFGGDLLSDLLVD